ASPSVHSRRNHLENREGNRLPGGGAALGRHRSAQLPPPLRHRQLPVRPHCRRSRPPRLGSGGPGGGAADRPVRCQHGTARHYAGHEPQPEHAARHPARLYRGAGPAGHSQAGGAQRARRQRFPADAPRVAGAVPVGVPVRSELVQGRRPGQVLHGPRRPRRRDGNQRDDA
ncbi:MAG: Creatinine amidohydrolase, partial [uncultured Cytophagales bacterium]